MEAADVLSVTPALEIGDPEGVDGVACFAELTLVDLPFPELSSFMDDCKK